MNPIPALVLLFLLAGDPPDRPWGEVRLTVFRDPYTSSDQVTLCRVRADNQGGKRWSGKALAFEVRAVGASPAVRARGRFGLMLEPHGSLETLVALPGRHDRFEVVPLPSRDQEDREQKVRRKPSHRKPRPGRAGS
ncbi:MAG TPA: hypothetical protein VN032_06330 [Thermoanaerobaculia bacterium]|jgi:hypothetical protein|nr:hypothetical protein [Thermoanaerobaculia bacterium]